ncbi:MAG TPA: hypothetical protein VM347_04615 [Nonomuraea sp.]|nr:hypothetical protein [Nonomuraea sp.]
MTATTRERLRALLDSLPDDQVETVLRFTEALRKGRVVVSACELTVADAAQSADVLPTANNSR